MKKILIICGPTATGKTQLAANIAVKYGGEIISADSRQVYKLMDIGTGKDSKVLGKIPVWGLDIARPDEEYSVAHFVKFTREVIKNIWQRKKLPVVVGGTGHWIKTLVDGADTLGIAPDKKLRSQLSGLTAPELRKILQKINPEKLKLMNRSDGNNPRRLVRAIEVGRQIKTDNPLHSYDLLMIGLKAGSFEDIYAKIDERVDKRVKQGIIKEIKSLIKKGYSWDLPSFSATGYGVFKEYLAGRESMEKAIARWKYEEHGLARRQMTFFKKDKRIIWFTPDDKSQENKIDKLISQWYSKTNGTAN